MDPRTIQATRDAIMDGLDRTSRLNAIPNNNDMGKAFEAIVQDVAPYISEWDLTCFRWGSEWPGRDEFYALGYQDTGIDLVGVRHDGDTLRHVAIQCKAHRLDDDGRGRAITRDEANKFAAGSGSPFWSERWIVTNGENPLSAATRQLGPMTGQPVKNVHINNDLQRQLTALSGADDDTKLCPHCVFPDGKFKQSLSCMQREAVAACVATLREHAGEGRARGRLVLPCGTGKTRVSLRIIEEFTSKGTYSIVLAPSIALVAQIRREYLQNARAPIRLLAVCSDATAGYDTRKEGKSIADDPTIDGSNVSAAEVRGPVFTDPTRIANWIMEGEDHPSVVIGTYQSGGGTGGGH